MSSIHGDMSSKYQSIPGSVDINQIADDNKSSFESNPAQAPRDINAEEAVLSCLLNNDEEALYFLNSLDSDAFSCSENKELFQLCAEGYKEIDSINYKGFIYYITQKNKLQDIGGRDRIIYLKNIISDGTPEQIIERMRQVVYKKKLYSALDSITSKLGSAGTNAAYFSQRSKSRD